MRLEPPSAFILSLVCLLLGGCRKEGVQTTIVPKELPAAAIPGMEPAAGAKEVDWKVPPGWIEQAPSSMRLGSFLIKGANGQRAEMSVVPLSGQAGGDLPNINRWRGQLNLAPISAPDLSAQSETMTPGGMKMLYLDYVSHELLVDQKFKKRVIGAIYHRGNRTWFFKMMGEDATVLSAKPAFIKFLKSLKFNEN